MNKPQQALQARMVRLIEEVGRPLTAKERLKLIDNLSKVKTDTLWTVTINNIFAQAESPARDEMIADLIRQLASQAVDDPFTMSCIVGHKTMVMLLRTFTDQ